MRARLIANPASGTDRAPALLPRINTRLRTLVDDLDITLTTSEDDAVHAAGRAAREGVDALYVAGGDGTLNAVLRGLRAVPGALEKVTIGVIPCGTGNDFSKALGLGEDPERAVEGLLTPRVLDVDLGLLNERPFVNTSAGGFVADVSQAVTPALKDATGKLAYLIGGARALLGTEPFGARVARDPDGPGPLPTTVTDAFDVQMFAVCNARFIGGGYPIAPGALVDDGLLDVMLVPRLPALEFIGVLQSIAGGTHADDPRVIQFRASEFVLTFDRPVRVNTDGELLQGEGCRYRVLPKAARFFCGETPQALAPPRPFRP